jgi:hypothetical protein
MAAQVHKEYLPAGEALDQHPCIWLPAQSKQTKELGTQCVSSQYTIEKIDTIYTFTKVTNGVFEPVPNCSK